MTARQRRVRDQKRLQRLRRIFGKNWFLRFKVDTVFKRLQVRWDKTGDLVFKTHTVQLKEICDTLNAMTPISKRARSLTYGVIKLKIPANVRINDKPYINKAPVLAVTDPWS